MEIMKQQVKKPGRPPQYVRFEGLTIVGLSGPKPPLDVDGRYYSSHNDPAGKRKYFGRDLEEAVRLFRAWKRRIRREQKIMLTSPRMEPKSQDNRASSLNGEIQKKEEGK